MKNQLLPVPEGYKAIVHHAFKADDVEFWTRLCRIPVHGKLPKYMTVVDIMDRETGELIATGTAKCSARDNPSRKLGRLIAHNRAVAEFFSTAPGKRVRDTQIKSFYAAYDEQLLKDLEDAEKNFVPAASR